MPNIVNRRGEPVSLPLNNNIIIVVPDKESNRIVQNLHIEDGYYIGLRDIAACQDDFEEDDLINIEIEDDIHPDEIAEVAEFIVKIAKTEKVYFFIKTTNILLIRAIEVFADLYDFMDNLDAYYTTTTQNGELFFDNVTYSEYGISTLYVELLSRQLDALEVQLEAKYEKEDA